MSRKAGYLQPLRHRLAKWEREKETNKHGKAHLADHVIRELRAEIESKRPSDSANNGGAEHG